MKTQMRDTSLEAYEQLKTDKQLQPREKQVIEAITELNGATDLQIAIYLGWQINQVTGRRNSLEKKGLVDTKRKIKQNGRMVYFWRIAQ